MVKTCGLTTIPVVTTDISGGIFFMLNVLPAQCEHGCKHGECVGPNKCKCFPGYTGKTCNQGKYLIIPKFFKLLHMVIANEKDIFGKYLQTAY